MHIPECPRCHKPNVAVKVSKKTGREYLANVETRDEWRGSYFRSLHTREECAAVIAERENAAANKIKYDEAVEAHRSKHIEIHAEIDAIVKSEGWNDKCEQMLREFLDAQPRLSDYPGAWI